MKPQPRRRKVVQEDGGGPRRERALVTGASSGLGAELARAFASRNFDLVLLARRREKLEELAREVRLQYAVDATVLTADLSIPNAAENVFNTLHKKNVRIDVLVNNAGVICEGDFVEASLEDQIRLLQTNVVAVTALTRLFTPPMIRQGGGRVLNVVSIAAFMPAPRIAVYAAAKAFVLSFSEAISEELRGSGVTVTALCPGFTDTSMLRGSRFGRSIPGAAVMSARDVARAGCEACLSGSAVCVPGVLNNATVSGARLLPKTIVRTLGGWLRRLNPAVPTSSPTSGGFDARQNRRIRSG